MFCMQIRSPGSVQLTAHQELFFWPKVLNATAPMLLLRSTMLNDAFLVH